MGIQPVTIGIVGLGGYAGAIRRQIFAEMDNGEPSLKLVAACDVDLAPHAAVVEDLRARGVTVVQGADQMFQLPMEAVALPLPIHLHRPMTEKALAAGKAVLCEKPAAGSLADVDAMIAARNRAGRPVAIGFQDTYHPATMTIKRRLLDGALGRILSVHVMACWPRTRKYYTRNTWAGARMRDGLWVMDSPLNNALAHYINIPLFLLGAAPHEAASPITVEAELYRARPIENYDTVSLRATLPGGVPLLVLLTHACQRQVDPVITILGERGSLTLYNNERAKWTIGQATETVDRDSHRSHMLQRFANLVRGIPDERAVATLEVARCHASVVWQAGQAASVVDVPPRFIREVDAGLPTGLRIIDGIEEAFARCLEQGNMLHESGLVPWSVTAGKATA